MPKKTHNEFAFCIWPVCTSKPDSRVVGPPALHHCAMLNVHRQAHQCPFVAESCYLHTNGRGHQAKLRWKVVWPLSSQIVVVLLALAYGMSTKSPAKKGAMVYWCGSHGRWSFCQGLAWQAQETGCDVGPRCQPAPATWAPRCVLFSAELSWHRTLHQLLAKVSLPARTTVRQHQPQQSCMRKW